MPKKFAWSFSALTGFESCPRQYYEMRILQAWPDPPGEAIIWGKKVHEQVEHRIVRGTPLPGHLKWYGDIIDRIEQGPGVLRAEYKLALNDKLQPVEFFAKDTWVRAVGDVVKINKNACFALDWKTGKFKDTVDQMKLQSAVTFNTYPHLEETVVSYAWLQEKRLTVQKYKRDDVPAIWQEFLPRVKRMELAVANTDFPPKPSGLCGKWCKVMTCEFNGQR